MQVPRIETSIERPHGIHCRQPPHNRMARLTEANVYIDGGERPHRIAWSRTSKTHIPKEVHHAATTSSTPYRAVWLSVLLARRTTATTLTATAAMPRLISDANAGGHHTP